jgi:hypothetical protein
MWYKLATIISVEQFKELLKKDASALNDIKNNYRLLSRKHHPDVDPDVDANQNILNLGIAYEPFKNKMGTTTNPPPNTPQNSNPKPNTPPAPNTTVKDLTLDKADKLERLRPDQNPVDDFDFDTVKRIEDEDIKLIGPKDDSDAKCIIEEEVFIQNLLTKLTGYAQIYFKKKIFTISQDTYGGNRSPLAPLQSALGLTPPGRLDPNTQAYDPASATPTNPLGDFKRNRGSITDPFGNPTAVMPTKDKTVVWNTADVQSIMSSLEKIAQMPELQKYGAKEITNILRYPLLQVKGSTKSIKKEIEEKKRQIRRYQDWARNPDPRISSESIQDEIRTLREELVKLEESQASKKPEVEVVPFKEFYKLTDLSRYFMYNGSQLNEVFCKLETQLIKTLNNTLNTLGKMEKNKRIQDIYKNARGK